jgi:uncharacterized membrane protein
MTGIDGSETIRLSAHADPFLVLLAPLWWIWSSPLVLLSAQAIAVASGAFPVYWLARKYLGSGRSAAAFAVCYLLYPATQFNAFTPIGIHAVSFAIPFVLFAIWFLDEDRLVLFSIFAILAATTKEEIGAAVGGLGIWYAIRRSRRRVGVAIFGAGCAVTCLNILVVIPRFAGGASPFAARYEKVGGTPTGMAHVALTDPGAFVHQVATWHKLAYLLLLFGPFLGLWALEPLLLVGAVPDLAINLLSSKPEQSTVFYQYPAGIVPFVVAASVVGAARLRRHRRRALMLVAAVMACVCVLSPLVYTLYTAHDASGAQIAATRRALALVPPNAPVSASQTLGAYVSARRSVSVFPYISRAQWVVVGPIAASFDNPHTFRAALARMKTSPHWKLVFDSHGITVFERRA